MVMLTRQTVILAKIETTNGTDASPDGSNAIKAFDVTVTPTVSVVEQKEYKSTIGAEKPRPGFKEIEVSFKTYLKGSGTTGTAPETSPLYQAAGLSETIVAGTSVTYAPSSVDDKTVTIYAYKDGTLHKLIGGKGNMKPGGKVGELTVLEWTFKGKTAAETQTSAPSPTYDSTEPATLLNAGMAFGGWSPIATAFSLDLGNDLARRDDMNEADGVKGYMITGRKITGSIDPEADPASLDVWAGLKAGTSYAFTVTVGSAAGNKCDIDCAACVLTSAPYGDRNGLVTHDAQFTCAETSGDDEITIVFT